MVLEAFVEPDVTEPADPDGGGDAPSWPQLETQTTQTVSQHHQVFDKEELPRPYIS